MIQKIKSTDRYHSRHGWLSTYHLFSFADYYDEGNMNFGVLRVFNDDTIDGNSGFGEHGHRDMEIVTVVLEGELTHTDSMGNSGRIKSSEVQYMSAGTGVIHSEYNNKNEPVHLYQLWLLPTSKNLLPDYNQKDFSEIKGTGIKLLATNRDNVEAIKIKSDASIYKISIEEGKEEIYQLTSGRGLFLYVEEGSIQINDIIFGVGDQARITNEEKITMRSDNSMKGILIDVLM